MPKIKNPLMQKILLFQFYFIFDYFNTVFRAFWCEKSAFSKIGNQRITLMDKGLSCTYFKWNLWNAHISGEFTICHCKLSNNWLLPRQFINWLLSRSLGSFINLLISLVLLESLQTAFFKISQDNARLELESANLMQFTF